MLKMAAPLDFFDAARRAEAPSSGGWHTCSVFCIIPHLPAARKGFCARGVGKFGGLRPLAPLGRKGSWPEGAEGIRMLQVSGVLRDLLRSDPLSQLR